MLIVVKFTLFLCLIFPISGYAYVGPGLGAGAIGAVLGVIGSIFIGLFAILYYPIKRKIKQRELERKKKSDIDQPSKEEGEE